MPSASEPIVLSRSLYDGVILDMDGVVTQTARIHAAAWKALFDPPGPTTGSRIRQRWRRF